MNEWKFPLKKKRDARLRRQAPRGRCLRCAVSAARCQAQKCGIQRGTWRFARIDGINVDGKCG